MKKIISALLVLSLLLGLTSPAWAGVVEYGAENNPNEKVYTQVFSDMPEDHWAFKFVAELVERGAINGFPDGKFYPNNIVTREQFAKIMVVAAGLTPKPAAVSSYMDVPLTYWASPFIETAKPYMTAYQNAQGTSFKPTVGALREDIAVAVVKLKGYDTRLADLSMIRTMFRDVDAISVAAQPYVALAVENGIISGYTDGTFRAQNTITRSEAAAMLWRAFQYGNDTKIVAGDVVNNPTQPTVTPPSQSGTPAATDKPFFVETLSRVTLSDPETHITADPQGHVYYYDSKQNAIKSVDTASKTPTTILDLKSASCVDCQGNACAELDIQQVFWDRLNGQLLALAAYTRADGWSVSEEKDSGVFLVGGDSLTQLFAWPKTDYTSSAQMDGKGNRIRLAGVMNNGNYLCYQRDDSPEYIGCAFYDPFSESLSAYLGNKMHPYSRGPIECVTDGSNVFIAGTLYLDYLDRQGIHRYDMSARQWQTVFKGDSAGVPSLLAGVAYLWDGKTIRAVRTQDGAAKTMVDLGNDVDITDALPLPALPSKLFAISEKQYIFYDNASHAIRVLCAASDT